MPALSSESDGSPSSALAAAHSASVRPAALILSSKLLAKRFVNVKDLHVDQRPSIQFIGNEGIKAFGEHCTLLTDLSLRFCDRVGDDTLIAIDQGCSLKHLNVSGCHQIGDAGITAIARCAISINV